MPSYSNQSSFPTFSTPPKSKSKNPWHPPVECQFKVCHRCRWSSAERSWLSVDGVVNGDYPPSAVTGFGFHFLGKRPVSLVKHALNLGLRPDPPRIPVGYSITITDHINSDLLTLHVQTSKLFVTPSRSPPVKPVPRTGVAWTLLQTPTKVKEPSSPFNDENSADTTFGQDANAYDNASMNRKFNSEALTPTVASRNGTTFGSIIQIAFGDEETANDLMTEAIIKQACQLADSAYNVRPPWTPPVSPVIKACKGKELEKFGEIEAKNGRR
jgi:hypothetical protein